MPRFIQNNPMAGVGNAERLALMKAQFDIDKAKQPTAVDRLSQFGQEIINYQADKAKVQVMAQQKQQQAEAQRREKVLDTKLKLGIDPADDELETLGINREQWTGYKEQKQKLAELKNQPSVKKLVANTETGMMDIFDIRSGEIFAGTIPISETIKAQDKPRVYSATRRDMMGNSTAVFYVQDPSNPTQMIEMVQKGSERSMQSDGSGGEAKAPAGFHFELDPITGEKNLVKD